MVWNIPLSSSTSNVPPTSSPEWQYYRPEKALPLCKPCSRITKTSLYYQPCVQHKPKTQPYSSHCEENSLYPGRNQHTPAHLKPSNTETGCWAMPFGCPVSLCRQISESQTSPPTCPAQGPRSLVPFLW